MFVHFTMGDLVSLSNSSEHVPFHSYCSHYFVFPSYSNNASHKTYFISLHLQQWCPLLFHFPLPVVFVVNKVLCSLIFCLVLNRLMEFDILFCYKFCSLNVMKSFH
jgi:hypothetical protein